MDEFHSLRAPRTDHYFVGAGEIADYAQRLIPPVDGSPLDRIVKYDPERTFYRPEVVERVMWDALVLVGYRRNEDSDFVLKRQAA